MAWRDALLRHLGPGVLGGLTLRDWLRLLRDNRFALSQRYLLRTLVVSYQSVTNSALGWYEDRRYRSRLKDVQVAPPLFVIGHWRSGTTHLHNLLAADGRLAFPNNYQVFYPHTFLTTERLSSRLIEPFLPPRRPMDRMEWDMRSPQEDEFALAAATGLSPYLGWAFPRRRDHYDRYLTFREVPAHEVARWQAALVLFLKKLTWKYRRTLVLKSPPHTCRIKLLLETFPGARFVHIRRNPLDVFRSSRLMFRTVFDLHRVQRPRADDLDGWVLRQYRVMYDAFFEERGLIPVGQFHELAYEELEKNPVVQLRHTYEALSLPDFGIVEPALRRYLASIAHYKKNEFADLPAELRSRIATSWRRCFEEWGYPV
jgi:hypothetical protein